MVNKNRTKKNKGDIKMSKIIFYLSVLFGYLSQALANVSAYFEDIESKLYMQAVFMRLRGR